MSGLAAVFERCHRERRAVFLPGVVAGDPNTGRSRQLLTALVDGGADLLWVGVPYAASLADGALAARAARRALERGGGLSPALEMIAVRRAELGVPVILRCAYNLVLCRSVSRFAEQAASSGVDAVFVEDLPAAEAEVELAPALRERGVTPVYALGLQPERALQRAVDAAQAELVLLEAGPELAADDELPATELAATRKLRRRLATPLAADLGVATPAQAEQAATVADAVVARGVFLRLIDRQASEPDLAARVEKRARVLAEALSGRARGRR